jgi:glycerol-3-phosphate dehydrogenase subunit B
MKYDLTVIGAGMSGLIAAAKAVERHQSTLIVTKGQGVLPLTSGCVDFWGYRLDNPGEVAPHPLAEITLLAQREPEHPYAKVLDVLVESVDFFRAIMREARYDFVGDLAENLTVLTALGTGHVTALAPRSMVVTAPSDLEHVVAVGFKHYPDYFPQMFLDNSAPYFPRAQKDIALLDLGGGEVLRSGYLSAQLEKEAVLSQVVAALRDLDCTRGKAGDRVLYVFPAVLGQRPDSDVWQKLTTALGSQVIEVPGLPPSVPGSRLDKALTLYLRRRGVAIAYNTEVVDFAAASGRLTSLLLRDAAGSERRVETGRVILATGSFLSGGLTAGKDDFREPIFNLPVTPPPATAEGNSFLSPAGQAFLTTSVAVDTQLQPLSPYGNLFAVGSILAGTNYAAEKSGLGLALATGYNAGSLA